MIRIDIYFLRLAVLYVLFGMGFGLWMGASGDHGMYPAHAHINLVGWASLALYGLFYRAYPAAARSRLAAWHLGFAGLGALILPLGIIGILSGHHEMGPVAGLGGALSLAGALLFASILFGSSGLSRRD